MDYVFLKYFPKDIIFFVKSSIFFLNVSEYLMYPRSYSLNEITLL